MKATIRGIEVEGTPAELYEFEHLGVVTVTISAPMLPPMCFHEYPEDWDSITAPACLKCGTPMVSPLGTFTA